MGKRGVRLIRAAIGLALVAACGGDGGGGHGQRWRLMSGVPEAHDMSGLLRVAAAGPDRIWVTGNGENMRWDGRWWHIDGPPDPIQAAAPTAPGQPLYVVGDYQHLWYTRSTSWSRVDVPALPGGGSPTLVGVAALGEEAWAVGSTGSLGDGASYLLHWDGARATSVPVPDVGALQAVTAVRPDDIWVQGIGAAATFNGPRTIVLLHWDGVRWTRSELGVRGVASGLIASGGSAWLYGGADTSSGKPFLFKLGPTPTRIDLPAGAGESTFTAGADDGHGGLWLASYTGGIDFPKAVYSHRTRSGSWTVTRAPEDPRGRRDIAYSGGEVFDMARVPGTDTIWAVGAKGSDEGGYEFYRLVQTYG